MRARGFTLVEVLIVCALAGVLAALAVPSYRGSVVKSHRSDATQALARLQAAQERYRAHNGYYVADLGALGLAPSSAAGLYSLAVEVSGPDDYRATARALPGSGQERDPGCATLELAVRSGFAQTGPTGCWQ